MGRPCTRVLSCSYVCGRPWFPISARPRVSGSTEVWADPWSPIDWTPFPWGALVGLAMAEPVQQGDPMRET